VKSRATLLGELVRLDRPVDRIVHEIGAFGWDSDVELFLLEKQHIRNVLARFLKGDADVSATIVRDWAEAIEGRDDIGFEDGSEELLKTILFDLANPAITVSLTRSTAEEFLRRLGFTP